MAEERRRKIVVYCSSRGDLPEDVVEGARLIAAAIGNNGADLVYGGVDAGLMHVVAAASHDAGAKVYGVIPAVFRHRADVLCDHIIATADLNARKGTMIAMGDAFVVLPGGIGTIDEWISTLSDIMVREKNDASADRPIHVWNHEGMYSGLVEQLSATAGSIYARGKRVDRSHIHATAAALVSALFGEQGEGDVAVKSKRAFKKS